MNYNSVPPFSFIERNMTTIDIIILIASGCRGDCRLYKGLYPSAWPLFLGLIVGLLAAKALYASLAEKLCPAVTDSMTVAQVLAFHNDLDCRSVDFCADCLLVDKSD